MMRIRPAIAILAIVSPGVSPLAGEPETVGIGKSLADRDCAWCHGALEQGLATAPQLAGQRPEYIENQLRSFQDHTRDNPPSQLYMWGAAARLNPDMAHDLAVYFSTLDTKAANDGDKELAPIGKAIYEEGLPDSNIPSCVACHGPDAQGVKEIPRLGGLSYYYLKSKLTQWGEGYHSAASPPMPGIASKLAADQIEALASYLSFVN